MKFEPLSELTKGFSPERWSRVEKIMDDMQREEDRQASAEESRGRNGPQAGRKSGTRPTRPAATARPEGR